MKGWEVIKTISENNIERGKLIYDIKGEIKCIDINNKALYWKPGEFSTSLLTSDIEFYIFDTKQIEEALKTFIESFIESMRKAGEVLIESVKKLLKEMEKK